MELTENIGNDALDIYPDQPSKSVMVDARKIADWNRDAYMRGRRDERKLNASQNASTSDEALPIGSVVKSWRHCDYCEKQQPHYQVLHCCECHN